MMMRGFAVGLVALFGAAGCAQAAAQPEPEQAEVPAELKSLVLDEAPTDVAHPLYVDFNGKAELIGYALEPAHLAAPGSKLMLKLFWRSTGKIGEGYRLYTQLVTPGNKRFDIEGAGPLRKGALNPSAWEPGKVYIDDLEITVPPEIEAARFSIVAGIERDPIKPEEPATAGVEAKPDAVKADEKPAEGSFGQVHLRVLSGPSDGRQGGIIATLETGVTPGAKRARTSKDEKRAGALQRRPSVPTLAKPREPGAVAAPAQPAK
jgi:hypothetical protein